MRFVFYPDSLAFLFSSFVLQLLWAAVNFCIIMICKTKFSCITWLFLCHMPFHRHLWVLNESIFSSDRILEFECNGIEISPGKTANCEVELWDCSGNHK